MSRSCSFSRRFSMLVIAIGWLLAAATVVSAEERVNTQRQLSVATTSDSFAGQCYGRRAVEVYLPMSGGDFEVVVIPNGVTVVNFPTWITLDKSDFVFEGFDVVQRPHQVLVAPLKGTPSGARANVAIKADKFAAVMNARLGSESDPYTGLIDVKPLPDDEYERRITEIRAKAKQRERERSAAAQLEARRERARTLLAERHAYPAERKLTRSDDEPYATLDRVTWSEGQQYIRFAFHAPVWRKHTLSEVRIQDGDRPTMPVDIVIQGGSHKDDGVIAVIEPDEQIEGIVLVPEEVRGDVDSLRLLFYSPNAIAPVVAAAQRFDFVPVPPEEIERRDRAKQVRLSLHLLGGALWMADGVGGSQLNATSYTGLGVRITKGVTISDPSLALEVDMIGVKTGGARFENVMAENIQGDLTRSAMLGRAQFGFALRFGDRIIPTVRAGLGVQGGNFDATMRTSSGDSNMLDSQFEFNGFVTFGGGVNVTFGKHLIAGIAAAAELPLGAKDNDLFGRSIAMEAHLGYGW